MRHSGAGSICQNRDAHIHSYCLVTITSHLIGLRLDALCHVNLVANQKQVISSTCQRISENKVELLLVRFVTNNETAAIW